MIKHVKHFLSRISWKYPLILVLINFAVFGLQALAAHYSPMSNIFDFAMSRGNMIDKPWTFVLAHFSHANWSHIISNMLWFIPSAFILSNGSRHKNLHWKLLIAATIITVNFVYLTFVPFSMSLGFSAIVAATVGAAFMILIGQLPSTHPRWWGVKAGLFMFFVLMMLPDIMGVFGPATGTGYLAHLIGYGVGFITGLLFGPFRDEVKIIKNKIDKLL